MSNVSIIIPIHNAVSTVGEAIESSISQGEVVKEIILVDDRSSDGSYEIMQTYQHSYPNLIHVIESVGNGGSAARNTGLSNSTGKYIQFLDADDILGTNKVATQVDLLEKTDGKKVASCSWYHFSNDVETADTRRQTIDKNYDNPTDWLVDSWNGLGMGQTGVWLTPKKLLDDLNGFDENLEVNQDGDFFCQVLLKSSGILFAPDAAVYYRRPRPESVSEQRDYQALKSILLSYKSYEKILEFEDSQRTRSALNSNYMQFVYSYYNMDQKLVEQALDYSRTLGFGHFTWPRNGLFSTVSKLVGYRSAFYLRKVLKGV